MRNRHSQWKKAGARFQTLWASVVNLKKVMAKLWKQLKTAGFTLDTQTNLGAFTNSDRPSELDRLRLRLAIGEPEKGSSRVRPTTWSYSNHILLFGQLILTSDCLIKLHLMISIIGA